MPTKRPCLITVFLTAVFVISLATVGAAQAKKYAALLGTWDVKTEEGGREFVFRILREG